MRMYDILKIAVPAGARETIKTSCGLPCDPNLLAISLGVQTKCLPSAKVYAPRMCLLVESGCCYPILA